MAHLKAASLGGKGHYNLLKRDTVIKLDSVKDKKLIKGKKSAPTSAIKKPVVKNDTTKKAANGLEEQVVSHAEDSTIFDRVKELTYLYGHARVTYGDFELDAEYIRVDQKKHLIFAKGAIDPITKRYIGRPISKQGKDKPVTSDSLLFDYKTKKGKIYNPFSDQDENYISGGEVKKLNENEVAYRNVLFSTCNLPYPDTHYGIVITRGIAEKNRIISGPAYLEIEGIPLPLAIPFGFFPKPDQRTSGVIIPTFGEDQALGFYLRNFGYYVGISDYLDLTNQGSIYSKGTYNIDEILHYQKRYKYSGSVNFSYGSQNLGLGAPPSKTFNIQWTHQQDANANPGSTLSASVNAGSSTFFQQNAVVTGYDPTQLTKNTLSSSVNYSKTWAGTPFNLNLGLTHSQDLFTKTVSLTLPTVSFLVTSLSPFDPKDRVGEQKWYQKITFSYSFTASNGVTAIPEAELFKGDYLFKHLQTRATHTIPVSLSLNVFKYFQFTTGVNYTENWVLQTVRKSFARGSVSGLDSLITDTIPGFKRYGNYNLSASLSTKIYSQVKFKKGDLIAIRHVITPSIGFSYSPAYAGGVNGDYQTIVSNATIPYPYATQVYSIFQAGGPNQFKQANINFNVDNTIEIKLKPKSTDTAGKDRKVAILDGLSFSTAYNIAADSFKLAPIAVSGHTTLFNQKVNLSFSGTFDPYITNVRDTISNNHIIKYPQRINRFSFQNGKFPALTNFNFMINGSLNAQSFKPPKVQPPPGSTLQTINPQQAQRLAFISNDPNAFVDFNIPWNLAFSYQFNYFNSFVNTATTNTVTLSGDFKLTDKWHVTYSTSYDLRALKVSGVPSFTFYRDLHCWDLHATWIPFGFYKMYSVTIAVKASILQDLKLSKKSDYTSNPGFGQFQ